MLLAPFNSRPRGGFAPREPSNTLYRSMLSKSKRSAIIMALVASLSRMTVGLALAVVTYPSSNEIAGLFQLDVVEGVIGNLALLITLVGFLLLLVIGVRAFVIYMLDETHFGVQGLVRWAILGALYAILVQCYAWFSPPALQSKFVEDLVEFVILVLCYWLVFRCPVFVPRQSGG
jgi:hypothetical protein